MLAFEQFRDLGPVVWKIESFVKTNCAGVERFGEHVILVLPFEDVWVREVEWLFENDTIVSPVEGVVAGSQSDLAELCRSVHDFEEHVPGVIAAEHERIGDEVCGDIGDVGTGQDRPRGLKIEGRNAGVDRDGPHIELSHKRHKRNILCLLWLSELS